VAAVQDALARSKARRIAIEVDQLQYVIVHCGHYVELFPAGSAMRMCRLSLERDELILTDGPRDEDGQLCPLDPALASAIRTALAQEPQE
jgi:hypothetical protein